VIKSFGEKQTEALAGDRLFANSRASRVRPNEKVEMLNAASRLDDLLVPPSKPDWKGSREPKVSLLDPHQRPMAHYFQMDRWASA